MQIDVHEVIEIPEYTETDRYRDLKNKVFALAKSGKPFSMPELPGGEYKYYSIMLGIFKRLIAKEITPEQAKEENEKAFKEFADEQMLYNARLSEAVDFNNNIKKSEMARARISKATTKADLVDAAADCIEALTNDKTIRAKLETLKDGDGA